MNDRAHGANRRPATGAAHVTWGRFAAARIGYDGPIC